MGKGGKGGSLDFLNSGFKQRSEREAELRASQAAEAAAAAAQAAAVAAEAAAKAEEGPAYPPNCVVAGIERLYAISTKAAPATFTIQSFDKEGQRKKRGGETFFVAVRGATRVRARIADPDTGDYIVSWQPGVSGSYHVAVSLFGEQLPGSPFDVLVHDPSPYAQMCTARGEALHSLVARTPSVFEVRYCDRSGRTAFPVELDVFITPQPEPSSNGGDGGDGSGGEAGRSMPSAWDVATHPLATKPGSKAGAPADEDGMVSHCSKLPPKRRGTNNKNKRIAEVAPAATASEPAPGKGCATAVEDDGYGSTDDLGVDPWTAFQQPSDRIVTRARAIPIQVGDRPLLVRESASLSSPLVAELPPASSATVVEERISSGGSYVRALVIFEMPKSSRPPNSGMGDDEKGWGEPDSPTSVTSSPDSGTRQHPSSSPSGSSTSPGSITAQRGAAACTPSVDGTILSVNETGKIVPFVAAGGPVAQLSGWATLRKGGKNLVTSRLRIDPWVRQQARLLWKMQQLHDRLQLSLQAEAAMLDPTGVGFAFGGVTPGWLHSKGQLHEQHKVAFSVDRVGRYLLHVRLRQACRPLPGSPFALLVHAAAAHQTTSFVAPSEQPLVGEVGLAAGDGCSYTLQTYDRVGNKCTEGGSEVVAACSDNKVEPQCADNGDGTYTLQWQSKQSGAFDAKVLINNCHVRGSPMKITLISTQPSLNKTEIWGEGLSHAVAGEPSIVRLKVFDQHANVCTPSSQWQLGLAIANTKQKLIDLASFGEWSGKWCKDASGEYELTFIAKRAGHKELYLWCNSEGECGADGRREGRQPLPGIPYSLHVIAGPPCPQNTYCDEMTREKSKTHGKEAKREAKKDEGKDGAAGDSATASLITAGDFVSVRANGVDRFGNLAQMSEAALIAKIVAPDGTDIILDVVNASRKGNNRVQSDAIAEPQSPEGASKGKSPQMSTTYELRHETCKSGKHTMHIQLDGEPIKGSPIEFAVMPAIPTQTQSVLLPPAEGVERLVADLDVPAVVLLKTCDRFGNECTTGGLRVQVRCTLVKQSQQDTSILMPNNHAVTVEDRENGTYAIKVALAMTATVKVIVNMDKDLPGPAGELAPMQLSFVSYKTPTSPPAAA